MMASSRRQATVKLWDMPTTLLLRLATRVENAVLGAGEEWYIVPSRQAYAKRQPLPTPSDEDLDPTEAVGAAMLNVKSYVRRVQALGISDLSVRTPDGVRLSDDGAALWLFYEVPLELATLSNATYVPLHTMSAWVECRPGLLEMLHPGDIWNNCIGARAPDDGVSTSPTILCLASHVLQETPAIADGYRTLVAAVGPDDSRLLPEPPTLVSWLRHTRELHREKQEALMLRRMMRDSTERYACAALPALIVSWWMTHLRQAISSDAGSLGSSRRMLLLSRDGVYCTAATVTYTASSGKQWNVLGAGTVNLTVVPCVPMGPNPTWKSLPRALAPSEFKSGDKDMLFLYTAATPGTAVVDDSAYRLGAVLGGTSFMQLSPAPASVCAPSVGADSACMVLTLMEQPPAAIYQFGPESI